MFQQVTIAKLNERSQSEAYVIRRKWIIAFTITEFLGLIPVLGLFGLLSNRYFGQRFWPFIAIIWVVFYLATASCLLSLRCPQCGKNYFGNFFALFGGYVSPGHRYSLFKKECANCGLRRNSN